MRRSGRSRRRRRWVRRLVFLALLVAAAWYWVVPAIVAARLRGAIQDVWDGGFEVGDVEVNLFGPARLERLVLRDHAGRTWLDVSDITVRLADWPGMHPKVSAVEVGGLKLQAWRRDGRIRPPLKPLPDQYADIDKYLALRDIRIRGVSLKLLDEGRPWLDLSGFDLAAGPQDKEWRLWLEGLPVGEMHWRRGQRHVRIAIGPRSGTEQLDLACTFDPETRRGRVDLTAAHTISQDQGAAIVAALGGPALARAGGHVRAEMTWTGSLDEPAALRPQGTVHLSDAAVATAAGSVADDVDLRVDVDGHTGRVVQGRVVTEAGTADLTGLRIEYDAEHSRLKSGVQIAARIRPRAELGGFWAAQAWLKDIPDAVVELAGTVEIRLDAPPPPTTAPAAMTRPTRDDPLLSMSLSGRVDLVMADPLGLLDRPRPASRPTAADTGATFRICARLGADLDWFGRPDRTDQPDQPDQPKNLRPVGTVWLKDVDVWGGQIHIVRGSRLNLKLNDRHGQFTDSLIATDAWSARIDGTTVTYDPPTGRLQADVEIVGSAHLSGTCWPFWTRWTGLREAHGLFDLAGPMTFDGRAKVPFRCRLDGQADLSILPVGTKGLRISRLLCSPMQVTQDGLEVPRLAGQVCGGQVQGSLRVSWQARPAGSAGVLTASRPADERPVLLSFRGDAIGIDMPKLTRALAAAEPMTLGRGSGRGSFTMHAGEVQSIRAEATIFLDDADVWQIPALSAAFKALGLRQLDTDLKATLTLVGPVATVRSGQLANALSGLVILPGGTVDFQRERVDFFVTIVPLKSLRQLLSGLPIINLLVTAKDAVTHIHVQGNWDDPPVRLVTHVPLKQVPQEMLNLFREISKGGGELGKGLFKPLTDLFKRDK